MPARALACPGHVACGDCGNLMDQTFVFQKPPHKPYLMVQCRSTACPQYNITRKLEGAVQVLSLNETPEERERRLGMQGSHL